MDRAAFEKAEAAQQSAGASLAGLVKGLLSLSAIHAHHMESARTLLAAWDKAHAESVAAIKAEPAKVSA